MIDAVHRYEGYVVQSTGDGIFAFFGAPIAHEDHPQRALAEQGQEEEGIAYLRQGLAASEATGGVQGRAYCLALLAEAYGKAGQTEEGLTALAEALATIHKNGERHFYAAELYRLKGQLTLQKFQVPSFEFQVTNPQPPTPKRRRKPKRTFRRPLRLPGGRVRSR
jgi:class 3 adenylate cyclase